MENFIADKNRIPIQEGDIVKIFHFKAGGRNHWMYKQVGRRVTTKSGVEYFEMHHLPYTHGKKLATGTDASDDTFWQIINNSIQAQWEIIHQSDITFFYERKKVKPTS